MRSNRDVPPLADSPLALATLRLGAGEGHRIADVERDSLLYVAAGEGSLHTDGETFALAPGAAALVLAGEEAAMEPSNGIHVLHATVGADADRHAPLGARASVVSPDDSEAERATGARSFRVLYGPHNGSTRATLFLGYVPPGKAPWHYHLYDEIVWIPQGPGRLHVGAGVEDLGPGSAFRLRPRETHILENTSSDRELTILGLFTPAGSPSAAYLTPDVAAEYRLAGS